MGDTTRVFGLAGLPGCGKSTAADIIVDELDILGIEATSTEVSDFVRAQYEEHAEDDGANDNELGRWAAEQKEKFGQGCFVGDMANQWTEADQVPVISGLRSPAEAQPLRFFYDEAAIIGVWTLPAIRFERKYGEPPTVEHPEWATFIERNERETHEWGCVEYFTEDGPSDFVVPNNGTIEEFEDCLRAVVRTAVEGDIVGEMFRTDTAPFPNMDAERVARYL